MIRIIILAVVGYVFYRALKSWMFPTPHSAKSVAGKDIGKIDDVMIKDPFCEAYFPKRNAVHLNFGGKDLYFCSAECKDQYITAQSENEKKSG
jgi:YHS domain-containing protein